MQAGIFNRVAHERKKAELGTMWGHAKRGVIVISLNYRRTLTPEIVLALVGLSQKNLIISSKAQRIKSKNLTQFSLRVKVSKLHSSCFRTHNH